MIKKEKINISEMYFRLFEQQKISAHDLDYAILERHKPNLQQLADTCNSVISIFDVHKKENVFNSSNLGAMFGYSQQEVENGGQHFLDTKIHAEDFVMLMHNSLSVFKLFFNFSADEKLKHKFVSEYRILNATGNYIRVVEQQQVLELDSRENLWLALSILDISPNQRNMDEGLKSEILNFQTGKIIPFMEPKEGITIQLTQRETEVLKLVKEGFLSKEISDKLSISLHTVNTYRQRFLEKLGVNNSMEAVKLASKLGLV